MSYGRVQQAFQVLSPEYNIFVEVSSMKHVKRGKCIWYISCLDKNGAEISAAAGKAMTEKFRTDRLNGGNSYGVDEVGPAITPL